jgi:hypothetical protein
MASKGLFGLDPMKQRVNEPQLYIIMGCLPLILCISALFLIGLVRRTLVLFIRSFSTKA